MQATSQNADLYAVPDAAPNAAPNAVQNFSTDGGVCAGPPVPVLYTQRATLPDAPVTRTFDIDCKIGRAHV